jgi:hypothetical protein
VRPRKESGQCTDPCAGGDWGPRRSIAPSPARATFDCRSLSTPIAQNAFYVNSASPRKGAYTRYIPKPTKYRIANLPVWSSKPRRRAIFTHQTCESVPRICSGFRATLAQVLHLGLGAQRVRFRIGGFTGDQRRRVRGRQASLTCAKRLTALRTRRSRPGTQNWPTPRCQATRPKLLSLAHRVEL